MRLVALEQIKYHCKQRYLIIVKPEYNDHPSDKNDEIYRKVNFR